MTNITWFWTMNKPQVPLAWQLHVIGSPLMSENLEFTTDFPMKYIKGDIYFCKETLDHIHKNIRQKINNDSTYPDKIKHKLEVTIKRLKDNIKQIKNQTPKNKQTKDLLETFLKTYKLIGEVAAFMSFKGTVQIGDVLDEKLKIMLQKKIHNREEKDDIYFLLTMPSEDSFILQEQIGLLKTTQEKKENISQLLKQHKEKFSWMNVVMFAGEPYTLEHYQNQLKQLAKKDTEALLKEKLETKKQREQKIKEIQETLNFTTQETTIIRQLREWMHLRTYLKDMTSIGMTKILPTIKELARRANTTHQILQHLSPQEIMQLVQNKNTEDILTESKKRQKAWGATYINQQSKYYNYTNIEQIKEKEATNLKEIKGRCACLGTAQGRAVVVKNLQDFDQVKEGDVLITHMTTPNFVPILEKVSAIVTDEGGLTCHAAIISREMNIPCIIGTRNATKVFKTGNKIFLDAKKGIVKKQK